MPLPHRGHYLAQRRLANMQISNVTRDPQLRFTPSGQATATFGVEKTAEGLQAIRWFNEGRLVEIAEYCCYDVKITKLVHEFGTQQRQLHYTNRFGKKMTVAVKW